MLRQAAHQFGLLIGIERGQGLRENAPARGLFGVGDSGTAVRRQSAEQQCAGNEESKEKSEHRCEEQVRLKHGVCLADAVISVMILSVAKENSPRPVTHVTQPRGTLAT